MIILGIGGLLGGRRLRGSERRRIGGRRRGSARWLARSPAGDALPQACHRECLRLAGAHARRRGLRRAGPSLRRRPESSSPLRTQFPNAEIVVVEHHPAHAASAFFPSPFEDATVLTLDHAGDFRCGARWHAQGNQLQLEKELYYPDSLGDLYSRVTELLGFSAGCGRTQSPVALRVRRRAFLALCSTRSWDPARGPASIAAFSTAIV